MSTSSPSPTASSATSSSPSAPVSSSPESPSSAAAAWQSAPAGQISSFFWPVAQRADGSEVRLPVLVARGNRPGKTLLLTAGVHGDEFEGMAAIRRLFAELDAAQLQGTVVAVPVANPPAYEAGLRVNPDDRLDLARIFPGDAGGNMSERVAWNLTHHLIRHADLYCDLHSAGSYYRMPPLAGYQLRPEPLNTVQREAAVAFGLPLVWGTPGLPGRTLSVAGEHQVPAIYTEITGEGRCRPADVERYLFGLRQLVSYLGIWPRKLESPPSAPRVVEDRRERAGFLQVQNRAPVAGLFEAEVDVWQSVAAGQTLGTIRDCHGRPLHTLVAARAGRPVFLRTFCRVQVGDALCLLLDDDIAGP